MLRPTMATVLLVLVSGCAAAPSPQSRVTGVADEYADRILWETVEHLRWEHVVMDTSRPGWFKFGHGGGTYHYPQPGFPMDPSTPVQFSESFGHVRDMTHFDFCVEGGGPLAVHLRYAPLNTTLFWAKFEEVDNRAWYSHCA